MYPRTNYEMTEADLKTLLESCKPTPAMWGPGGAPMFDSPQENANRAWKALGAKMGFVWDSCQPIAGKGQRFFTAIPSENETQRAEREAREATEKRQREIDDLTAEIAAKQERLSALRGEGAVGEMCADSERRNSANVQAERP